MDASIVICAFNEEGAIRAAVKSALDQKAAPYSWEVIVVDDGSTDGTRTEAVRFTKTTDGAVPFTYLRIKHAGLSTARNAGVHASSGRVIAFLDADAIAAPDWLRHLLEAFSSESVVGVGGNVRIRNRENQFARFIDCFHHRRAYTRPQVTPPIIGANMAFQKAVLLKMRGFVAEFVSRGDDDTIRWKAGQLGNLIYVPKALVWHDRPASWSEWLVERKRNGAARADVDRYVDSRESRSTPFSNPWNSRVMKGRLRTSYVALFAAGLVIGLTSTYAAVVLLILSSILGTVRASIYYVRGLTTLMQCLANRNLILKAVGLGYAASLSIVSCLVNDTSYFLQSWKRRQGKWSEDASGTVVERNSTITAGVV